MCSRYKRTVLGVQSPDTRYQNSGKFWGLLRVVNPPLLTLMSHKIHVYCRKFLSIESIAPGTMRIYITETTDCRSFVHVTKLINQRDQGAKYVYILHRKRSEKRRCHHGNVLLCVYVRSVFCCDRDGVLFYKLKWVGFEPTEQDWVPADHLQDATELINEFNDRMAQVP